MTQPTSASPSGEPNRERYRAFFDGIVGRIDQQTAEILESLPSEFFAQVSEADQLEHVKALLAMRLCGIDQEIMLRQRNGRRVTVISPNNYAGLLSELFERVPEQGELVGAQVFSGRNQQFVIDVFDFKTDAPTSATFQDEQLLSQVSALTGADSSTIASFVGQYDPENAILQSPAEIARQFEAYQRNHQEDRDLTVIWEAVPNQPSFSESGKRFAKVIVSSRNASTRYVFRRTAKFFARFLIDIERAYCQSVELDCGNQSALLTFYICIEDEAFNSVRQRFDDQCSEMLDGDILREKLESFLKLDDEVILADSDSGESIFDQFSTAVDGEIFCGLARLTHYRLAFCSGLELTREQILRRLSRYPELTQRLVARFRNRFPVDQPEPGDDPILPTTASTSISDALDRNIVDTFQQIAESVERCNFLLSNRNALAFRLPGNLFQPADGDAPFAVFYVYGRGFDGFHVRFRDVARGGVRIVKTRNPEHYLFESTRIFDEVYRLAFAQQLKNKDIAEGGAKAVVVLKPDTNLDRAGHDFVDGLLDLLTLIPETSARDLPATGAELIYMGPDENVTNSLIEWIVERAAARNYAIPETIMSSKPDTGINHKEFGVTSEGVIVFLHHALQEIGIQPETDPFTVAMTGGPDGDVGGNAIKILLREYGAQVRIVAIADGTGAAHDPNGLEPQELTRLVEQERGIVHFNEARLGPGGNVFDLASESGLAFRNNLPFMVKSDVFLPAGGRPSTINQSNSHQFLDSDGTPNARVIVEGANLFITEQARRHLSERGVLIVKDSSANKCGVICSSLEIISGMLLTAEQFQSIKPEFVDDILNLLRRLARIEAISLFNEYARGGGQTLPELSVELSRQIIRIADIVTLDMETWQEPEQQLANRLMIDFLPASLCKAVGPDLASKIPSVYRAQLLSALIASKLVYREGIRNLCDVPAPRLSQLARQQLVCEVDILDLIDQVRSSDAPHADKLVSILEHAGARAQRELRLGY